jgi:hypothetical protein
MFASNNFFHYFAETFLLQNTFLLLRFDFFAVLRSRSRKEPHHLVGAGAGAVTRCGSGSHNGIKHG